MKTIGLIGGASYQSTLTYYKMINEQVNQQLGKQHSAKIVMVSLEFNEIVDAFYENRWNDIRRIMIDAAYRLKRAGADFIAICCNTLHKVAPDVADAVQLPLLHILNPTAAAIQKLKLCQVAVLGARFTMQELFHRDYLVNTFGIRTLVPNKKDIERLNAVIFDELCYGIICDDSRQTITEIIHRLEQDGAQGVVLACTELPNLLPLPQVSVPIFNTTALHADAIVARALRVRVGLSKRAQLLPMTLSTARQEAHSNDVVLPIAL